MYLRMNVYIFKKLNQSLLVKYEIHFSSITASDVEQKVTCFDGIPCGEFEIVDDLRDLIGS